MKSSAWSGLLEPENLMGLEQIFKPEPKKKPDVYGSFEPK